MLSFHADDVDPEVIVTELLDGGGAVMLKGLFTQDEIAEARRIILMHSDAEAAKVTHFQGAAGDRMDLQRRVWNLLAKGAVFSRMATHPVLMTILRHFLGTGFIMGSIAANRILPGGPGQEPHVDYPYWDFHAPETHPTRLNASFPMNAQVTVVLDPFTEASGATAYVPGTQTALRYPGPEDDFHGRAVRMIAEPGDTVLFFGAAWHCAMPNRSDHERCAVLVNYLPKWVKPLEDMPGALPAAFLDGASRELRQLLGFDYPYPEVLDRADAVNAEGRA
ncbi:phytanoyl-CoA dioxygenase family protein [uncultured Jannaschia sp.]|uniref:phytanoyl-CoA dioxygenase family protein n=1 Tax=uncultured Jannaschia sp. TaxID=293347 RepID=UPI002608AD37|nr:phytanoyl-CoA dioxygenase family protein [uncultured Jannaschia sp.]